MTDHTDLIQCLRHAHEQRLISDLRAHGDSADRKFVCRIVASARVAADNLEAQAAKIAELEAALKAARTAQIARGDVLSTSGAEARWIEDTENACPSCGGSGHRDDAALTWQPIETAPKDGTEIICLLRAKVVRLCWYFARSSTTFGFLDESGNDVNPILWMPLPPAPQEGE